MLTRRAAFVGATALWGCGAPSVAQAPQGATVSAFPQALNPRCNSRALLYDECSSQTLVFDQALQAAREARKIVFVNYGAEWCIWCHVFDAYLRGRSGRFRYPVEGDQVTLLERGAHDAIADARALNAFASTSVVLAHIEADNAPDGRLVLEASGAAPHFNEEYPFIFSGTPAGRYAAMFRHDGVEVRREGPDWYRGYDRSRLLAELTRMRNAAMS